MQVSCLKDKPNMRAGAKGDIPEVVGRYRSSIRDKLFVFFLVWNPQASAPITSGTHIDGGAVLRKPGSVWLEGTPAINIIFIFCFMIVFSK